MKSVVIRFGKRKLTKMGETYLVTIPAAIAKTLKEEGVTEFEVVWVNDHLALYPVKIKSKRRDRNDILGPFRAIL
jgi:hypothetical protein